MVCLMFEYVLVPFGSLVMAFSWSFSGGLLLTLTRFVTGGTKIWLPGQRKKTIFEHFPSFFLAKTDNGHRGR